MSEKPQQFKIQVTYQEAPKTSSYTVYAFDEENAVEYAKQCFLDDRRDNPIIISTENITPKPIKSMSNCVMNSPQIDKAALEAAAEAIYNSDGHTLWDITESYEKSQCRKFANAAIVAYLSAAKPETVTADGDALLGCPFCSHRPKVNKLGFVKCSNKDCFISDIGGVTPSLWQTRAAAKATQSCQQQGFAKGAEWMRNNCSALFVPGGWELPAINALPLTDDGAK